MAETKKIRVLSRVGDPRNGAIIQPGTVLDFPATWADRYIGEGFAEEVTEPKAEKSKPKAKKK